MPEVHSCAVNYTGRSFLQMWSAIRAVTLQQAGRHLYSPPSWRGFSSDDTEVAKCNDHVKHWVHLNDWDTGTSTCDSMQTLAASFNPFTEL